MVQRTLWGAIDRDRRRWIRAGALVVGLLGMLAYAVWIVATSRSVAAWQIVARVLVPLAAILMFPLVRTARDLRTRQAIGAVPVATGMLPDTKSALHDVALAAGLTRPPTLLMYFSDALNAFVTDRDPTLFAAWLDAAVAGDREGLKILGEPVPMIELLELLSITSTIVPEFAYADGHDAVFGFLAWPYVDSAKVMAEEFSAHGKGMPAKAAAAVAALIAEERSMSGSLGFVGVQSSSFSGAEALRALRLREVSGAEGAIAGSTAAAATRREGHVGASGDVGEPTAAVGDNPSAASESEQANGSNVPTLSPALAFADTGLVSYGRNRRITVRCPACQANNAPGNRTCIACRRRLPSTD
jgi:hypothetical protein